MSSEDDNQAPPKRRPVRRAIGVTLRYLISPSFFKIKSPNPFKVHGPMAEKLVVEPMHARHERRRQGKAIDREIDTFSLTSWTRDRYIFETYAKHFGLSEADMLVHHYNYARRARSRLIFTTLGAVAVFVLVHYIAAGHFGHLFALSLFAQSPTWVAIGVAPPLVASYVAAIRDLFHAWCIRERRHGSVAAFVLWVSSPEQWLVSARLSKLPAVEPLPKELADTLSEPAP